MLEQAEFAFQKPFPYGLARKMTVRTIYHAQKLMVWTTKPSTVKATLNKKIQEGVYNTLQSVSRIAKWAATCASPSFGFVFDVKEYPDVYEPAEDSFLLADSVGEYINSYYGQHRVIFNVLEIGCGSGIISYILKSQNVQIVRAVDINPHAIECARKNGIDAIQSDMFDKVQSKFDIILFNPPYLPDDSGDSYNEGMDRALYGGKTGREVINKFFTDAKGYLNKNGSIFIVISTHTGVQQIKDMAHENEYYIVQTDTFENLSTWRLQPQCA